MHLSDGKATRQQPTSKAPLVRLGKLGTAEDIDAKPVEMNLLAVDDAHDHPAQGWPVVGVLPGDVPLTQECNAYNAS